MDITAEELRTFIVYWIKKYSGLRPSIIKLLGDKYHTHTLSNLAPKRIKIMRFTFYRTGKREQIINIQEFPGGKSVCKTSDKYASLILAAPLLLKTLHEAIVMLRNTYSDCDPKEKQELLSKMSSLYLEAGGKINLD